MAAVSATVGSAIVTKELSLPALPMAAVDTVSFSAGPVLASETPALPRVLATNEPEVAQADTDEEPAIEAPAVDDDALQYAIDPEVRWFNGRPARPARKYWMTVTGYSPDARSCGESADGLTATLHSVQTNNMKLVAADPTFLPYGSMLTIPGYDESGIVPVLDCGGAIKGRRLDLLYPTHEQARKWGRQRVLVTVWEYADGKPAENVRKVR